MIRIRQVAPFMPIITALAEKLAGVTSDVYIAEGYKGTVLQVILQTGLKDDPRIPATNVEYGWNIEILGSRFRLIAPGQGALVEPEVIADYIAVDIERILSDVYPNS